MLLFLLNSLAFASPNLASINKAIDTYNSYAVFSLPTLSSGQYSTLKAGEVITILDQAAQDQPQRAIGILLSPVPPKQLWVSCQDPHFTQQSLTTEKQIHLNSNNSAEWYGFMDVPWPFSDRHWVVNVSNNTSMASKTQNACWEHPWDLVPAASKKVYPYIEKDELSNISEEMVESAIYTPTNKGAWALIQVDDHSLLIYHATTVVGGSIPSDLVVKLVRSTLDDMLKDIELRAEKDILTHYTGDHFLILGGDGKNVPHFDISEH